jgi:hypothetical protein
MPTKMKEDHNGNSGLDYNDLLMTALGLTVALSWNTAAKETIDAIHPVKDKNNAFMYVVYAVVVTIIAIMILYTISFAKVFADNAVSRFEAYRCKNKKYNYTTKTNMFYNTS